MPAIRLQALRERADVLYQTWQKGETPFYRALSFTWQRYGFPGHKEGRDQLSDALPAHHVPKGVLHVIAQRWHQHLTHPEERRRFLEALWRHPVLESKEAAALLWTMQPRMEDEDVARFWRWYPETWANPSLRRVLLDMVASRLARERTASYSEPLFQRLEKAAPEQLPHLLPLFLPLLHVPAFDDFPRLRTHFTPWLSPPAAEALPEWTALLRALFRRWPGEVMPWIRQLVHRHGGEPWAWLLRRLYPWLEEPWKSRVRTLLREVQTDQGPQGA